MSLQALRDRMAAPRRRAFASGGVALAVGLVSAVFWPDAFFEAYLVGFLLVAGAALGSLALLSLQHVAAGEWGFVSRRTLEAASRTVYFLPLLFAPLLFGLDRLYPWWSPAESSDLVAHKAPYLNRAFFLVRAAVYFTVWAVLAWRLNKWSREQDEGERVYVNRLQMLGAVGMLLYGLTITFASVDWVMSREPAWYSTIYGLLFMVGQVLTALAFTVLALRELRGHEPLSATLRPSHFHDLGNLALAFVLLWAYMAFSQYLIIWAGNLPEEIPWYLRRSEGGWSLVAIALVVLHFALPFFLLLSRRNKKRTETLCRIAYVILVARLIDMIWLVKPASEASPSLSPLDLIVPAGIALLWLGLFIGEVGKEPLLPLNDPRFAEVTASTKEALHGAR